MLKSPKFKNGMLVCPNCDSPLLTYEYLDGTVRCLICDKPIGKLSFAVMKKLVKNFSSRKFIEWSIETQAKTV